MTPSPRPFPVYLVGGAVRDKLLRAAGFDAPTGDCDYMVTGALPEDLIRRGFQPVGADFPVFLHPETHEEYALARTERKTAPGYHGFCVHTSPDVTVEEDLLRRDLTINAMAMDAEGHLIDPYGGRRDIEQRLLRHVSPAFAEDPVRILRAARFAARFPAFGLAPETRALMQTMVNAGEVDALVAERVWAELSRAMMERAPLRFFEILAACGALERLFPWLQVSDSIRQALESATAAKAPLAVRLAVLVSELPDEKAAQAALLALRAPAELQEFAGLVVRLRPLTPARLESAQAAARVLESADVLRRPERFEAILTALALLQPVDASALTRCAAAWRSVNAGDVARAQTDRRRIPAAVREARLAALEAVLGH